MTGNNGLPQGWAWTTVGDIAEKIQYGHTESANNSEVGPKFLRITDIQNGNVEWDDVPYCVCSDEQHEKYRLNDGDIVFARTGATTGKSYLIQNPPDAVFASYLIRLHLKTNISAKYISLYFQSSAYWRQIIHERKGVTQPSVNASILSTLQVPLPPRPEQERIVAKLEETFTQLEAGVAELQNAKAQLKRYRAAVLKSAVEGELTREWRESHQGQIEPAETLQARILEERRKKWESEGGKGKYKEPAAPNIDDLPRLPEGWVWATLDQCFTVERGRFSIRPRNDPRYYDGLYPFVQIGDLPRDGGNITSYSKTLNEAGLKVSRYFQKGTVLVAIVGATIANTGVLTFESCSPDSLVAIQSDDEIRQRFVEIYLRYNKLKIRGEAYASGGQPNINLQVLLLYPIPMPSHKEQQRIVEMVERRLSVADEIEKELDESLVRAERLRGAVLKSAFEGRLV